MAWEPSLLALPSPIPALERSPSETTMGIELFRYADALGYLHEHTNWPQVTPAKQLSLAQDLALCHLGLQGHCIIPNPH